MSIIQKIKQDRAFRYKIEKWFWIAMVLPTIVWLRNSVLWVGLLSIYALVITAGGAQEAAKAAQEATETNSKEQK